LEEAKKVNLKEWESKKNPTYREVERQLKSCVIWIEKGDENAKYFHNLANHQKQINPLSELQREDGDLAKGFNDLANSGVKCQLLSYYV
jgi:hypothetical protein